MAIALVQQATGVTTGATSVAVTIAAPGVGNFLVATCINNAARVTGITGGGVTWQLAKQSPFGYYAADIWYGYASSGSGTTVTLTFSGNNYGAAWVGEFSGIKTSAGVDATTDTDDTNSSSQSTGGFTASASPVLNLAVLALSGGAQTNSGPTGGFTAATVANAGGVMRNYTAYRIDTTAASNLVGWTTSVAFPWSASMAAFHGASSFDASAGAVSISGVALAASPGVSARAGLASVTGSATSVAFNTSSVAAELATITAWASEGAYSELDLDPPLVPLDMVAHPAATAVASQPAPSVEVNAGLAEVFVRAYGRFPDLPVSTTPRIPPTGAIRQGTPGRIGHGAIRRPS